MTDFFGEYIKALQEFETAEADLKRVGKYVAEVGTKLHEAPEKCGNRNGEIVLERNVHPGTTVKQSSWPDYSALHKSVARYLDACQSVKVTWNAIQMNDRPFLKQPPEACLSH